MAITFTYDDGWDGNGERGRITKVSAAFTATTTAAFTGTTQKLVGTLRHAIATGTSGLTANWDAQVKNADSFDVLTECKEGLLNLSASGTVDRYFYIQPSSSLVDGIGMSPSVCGPLTLSISNHGSGAVGQIDLYLER